MRSHDTRADDTTNREALARATLLRITPRRWRLIHAFESVARFLLSRASTQGTMVPLDARPDSILVIEYWHLGDLAILVPFLRNLRQSFPKAQISLMANAALPRFLEGQGLVDEIIPVRVPWAQHFNRWLKYNPFSPDWISLTRTLLFLKKRRFDWAFSGRMDVRDNVILWLSGARRRIGYGIGGGGSFLTDCATPDLSRPHRADAWLHLLEAIDVSVDRKLDRFRLADRELASAQSYLAGLGLPLDAFLIGVHPGARGATRRWGEDRFAEVVHRLLKETDAHILWFSEPGKPSQVPPLERCHFVSVDFQHFLALLSCCRLLVCNDSGPMHLANLLDVPVVAVFGPQRPEWFGPRGSHDRVVIHPEFSCRPCFDYCIFDTPHCLTTIPPEEVYSAVDQVFQGLRFTQNRGRTL